MELVSKLKRGDKVVTDIFSLCDACVCAVGVTYILSPLSAVTHHRIIYNSAPRPSRARGGTQIGFPTDNTGVEQQLPASHASLHPCTHTGDYISLLVPVQKREGYCH